MEDAGLLFVKGGRLLITSWKIWERGLLELLWIEKTMTKDIRKKIAGGKIKKLNHGTRDQTGLFPMAVWPSQSVGGRKRWVGLIM